MAEKKYASQQLDRYIIKFPDGMRDQLKKAAKENNRSLNAEIVKRLEVTLSQYFFVVHPNTYTAMRKAAEKSGRNIDAEFNARFESSFVPTINLSREEKSELREIIDEQYELKQTIREFDRTVKKIVSNLNDRLEKLEGTPSK